MNVVLRFGACAAIALVVLALAGNAMAISVTASTDAMALANYMTQFGGVTVTSAKLYGFSNVVGASSSGTFTNATGTYGIAPGIVLSSGNVMNYGDGPNTSTQFTTGWGPEATAAQYLLLKPIVGTKVCRDVTQLDITFDMMPGYDTVYFNVVWGTEEHPESRGTIWTDVFGLYVNGTNIALVNGLPVTVNNPWMKAIAGTELDGILNGGVPTGPTIIPVTFSKFVGAGSTNNTLTFIISDTGDDTSDSTVYITQFIPEPMTMLAVFGGLAMLGGYIRKRRIA